MKVDEWRARLNIAFMRVYLSAYAEAAMDVKKMQGHALPTGSAQEERAAAYALIGARVDLAAATRGVVAESLSDPSLDFVLRSAFELAALEAYALGYGGGPLPPESQRALAAARLLATLNALGNV